MIPPFFFLVDSWVVNIFSSVGHTVSSETTQLRHGGAEAVKGCGWVPIKPSIFRGVGWRWPESQVSWLLVSNLEPVFISWFWSLGRGCVRCQLKVKLDEGCRNSLYHLCNTSVNLKWLLPPKFWKWSRNDLVIRPWGKASISPALFQLPTGDSYSLHGHP